ncbi:hypothetical protein OUZ56_004381 [Daphnia magna]|uniref:Uncharacterized protein n=1 Tax=Daphnia magna TaxID=35525 RepID=A0ABQ9YPL4_9CRUS|nr:hypothetical protein OUZ56_004381 [Daphnia magna]
MGNYSTGNADVREFTSHNARLQRLWKVSGKHSGRIRLSLDSKMLARSCRESCIVKAAQLLPSRVYTRTVLKIGQRRRTGVISCAAAAMSEEGT